MNKFIKVFIISSSEYLHLAEAFAANLQTFDVYIWNSYVFNPGETAIQSLTQKISESDFSIVLLTPDDEIRSRDLQQQAPRDNVLIEYGLSIGILGVIRTFYLYEKDRNVKIPTDIIGINGVQYNQIHSEDQKEMANSVRAVCKNIELRMLEIGIRKRNIPSINDFKAHVDIYYYKKDFTKEMAEDFALKLRQYNIDFTLKKHDPYEKPDTIFIGCCVPVYFAQTVLKLLTYEVKFIYSLDYPEVEGGDENGFLIGVGYSSQYNKRDTEPRYLPIPISEANLNKLKNDSMTNTEFHIFMHKLTTPHVK